MDYQYLRRQQSLKTRWCIVGIIVSGSDRIIRQEKLGLITHGEIRLQNAK